MRFGGEDVVRHRLVQRIVEAYDEHAEAARAPTRAARVLEVEVIGTAADRRRPRSSASPRWPPPRPASRTGHVAVEFVDADRIRDAQPRAPRQGPPDRRPVLPGRRARARRPAARELGDVVICPEHTEDLREAVVHGVLHLTGMDHETDDGEMLALQAELLTW